MIEANGNPKPSAPKKRTSVNLSSILRVLVSLALIVAVLFLVDSAEFIRAAANVKPVYLLLVILLVIVDRLIVV